MSDILEATKVVEPQAIDIKSTFDLLDLVMAPHQVASQLPLADERLVVGSVDVVGEVVIFYELESRTTTRLLILRWSPKGWLVSSNTKLQKTDPLSQSEKIDVGETLGVREPGYWLHLAWGDDSRAASHLGMRVEAWAHQAERFNNFNNGLGRK